MDTHLQEKKKKDTYLIPHTNKTIKLLKEPWKNLCDLGSDRDVSHMTLKAQSIKATTGKLGLINIKKTSALRKTPKKEEQAKAQTGGKHLQITFVTKRLYAD